VGTGELPEIVLPSGDTARAVTGYQDVRLVLADPRFTRELHKVPGSPRMVRGADMSDDIHSILNMDPPRHTRIRRIVSGALTPARVRDWRPRITAITASLIAEMKTGEGRADLVTAFAWPLPAQVAGELLGVPPDDKTTFQGGIEDLLGTEEVDMDRRISSARAFRSYVKGLIATRRAAPGDALIDALIQSRDGDDTLDDRELVSLVLTLISAGYETTGAMITRAVLTLLAEGRFARLVADPGLVPGHVEELLRRDSPAEIALLRLATEDVELSCGTVRAGQAVVPVLHDANRDPAVFARPDELDVERGAERHLSFGHGPHYCLGANLAMAEVEIALTSLASEMPGLALAVSPGDLRWRDSQVHCPSALPVTW
jgi:cytochrome P450